MDLSQIYSTQIKRRPVNMLTAGGNFPQIEKDPTIRKLENNVFAKMKEIVGEDNFNNSSNISQNTVKAVSFAEAIKELSQMVKNKTQ